MLINRKHLNPRESEHPKIAGHLGWMIFFGVSFAVSLVCYVVFQTRAPYGPSGGSLAGLLFGSGAFICMFLPAALTWRKKKPLYVLKKSKNQKNPKRARYGSAQFWMKGHIWLGLLSLPLTVFHTGFDFGGSLEFWLMLLVFVVWFSGVLGLVLQQFLPSAMMKGISAEAMAAHIDAVCLRLRETADRAVQEVCGSLFPEDQVESEGLERLRGFYLDKVRPYLGPQRRVPPGSSFLHSPSYCEAIFEQQRKAAGDDVRDVQNLLMTLCNERRGLRSQQRLHGWLHGWLWIHIPLSMTLIVMLVIHVGSALTY